ILDATPDFAPRRRRARQPAPTEALAKATAESAKPDTVEDDAPPPAPVDITARGNVEPTPQAVAEEAGKGYDFLLIGVEPTGEEGKFDDKVARIAEQFDGPYAIAAARGSYRRPEFRQVLNILVPVTGTAFSRH